MLGDGSAAEVVAHVVEAQLDPSRHVIYLGCDAASIATDLTAVAAWRDRTWVARDDGGTVVGVLTADVDADRGRLWWLGPWARSTAVSQALLDAAEAGLDGLAREREFAPDERNTDLVRIALDRGYVADEMSAVLVCDLEEWPHVQLPDLALVRPLEPDDRAAVARLHDQLFPGTHTAGRVLVADEDSTVHVYGDEDPVGYVATQVQADGSGYIDFLGVAPGARGRGHGRALIAAAMTALADRDVPTANLTVRAGNTRARALYASLGFEEERRATPMRSGFRIVPPA